MKRSTKSILKLIKTCSRKEKVYVVGGWLRDLLLGRSNRDLDVVSSGDPLSAARRFARAAGGSFVILDRKNRVYRVVLKDESELEYVDFAKMKARVITADLMKRDFTVNSMAAEVLAGGELDLKDVIDPSSGKADIKKRVIRMTYAGSFFDDPLRILRAFRIACELGFDIEPATIKAARSSSRLILKSAPERSRDELLKIFACGDSSAWISYLEKTGVLEKLIPEITPMKRSARRFYFHPKGLWQHSMLTLESMENIIAGIGKYFPDTHEAIEEHMRTPLSSGSDRKSLLKFVAVLHDCAKPIVAKKFKNKTRFLGHEKKGARMLERIFRRLRMSAKEISVAKNLVENHMRPVSLSQSGTVTQRASFRLFRDMGENTPDLLLLALADWHSYKSIQTGKPKNLKVQQAVLKELVYRYFAQRDRRDAPKVIDGNILMDKLGLEPGPIIGALLKAVNEAQFLGKVKTNDEALAFASARLTRLAKKYRIKTN